MIQNENRKVMLQMSFIPLCLFRKYPPVPQYVELYWNLDNLPKSGKTSQNPNLDSQVLKDNFQRVFIKKHVVEGNRLKTDSF
ncbi:hypothetical protein DHD80_00070 [Gramella sp. AN32]|nr:hypothetical protein [Gramella sp. AN32]